LSPSDLKEIKEPLWLQPNKGAPTLMLFSVVDDRSGVAYQEYRCVYGEDVEAALRFLFNAMAPKLIDGFLFQGIPKIPTQPERRERALRDLIKKRQKPIALFIDDAHDLHSKTLIGLKRLIEVVRDSGGMLSVVLAGHPKLKNDLRRSSMEEIGSRASIFELEGLGSEKRKYLKWLLAQSVAPKTKIESVITDDAVAMLSEKLSTPLQFEYYLTRALEEAYKVGQKPVGADMIENVLAKDINGLEPRLTRQGYNAKVLAELLNAKPREIRSFLSGQLAAGRTQELQSELLAAGIPL
jgi:hypothetical protein